MTWTQPLCDACWETARPGHAPTRVFDDTMTAPISETCCRCGQPTEGIYVRIDPSTVPYPREEPSDD